jgi:hypothetical protein
MIAPVFFWLAITFFLALALWPVVILVIARIWHGFSLRELLMAVFLTGLFLGLLTISLG